MTNKTELGCFETQYKSILSDLIDQAEPDMDRTGTGRIRTFSRDIHIDMSEHKLPILTCRKINVEHGIHELLWMIGGHTNIKHLDDSTKPIWKGWAVTKEHISKFIKKISPDIPEEELTMAIDNIARKKEGSIGKMYGEFWRDNPSREETMFVPVGEIDIEDIPSDKKELYSKQYAEILYFAGLENPDATLEDLEIPPYDFFVKSQYFHSNDQLGEVIRGLKKRPYSSRHVISSWIPEFMPTETGLSPQENVLIGRGALAACHVLSQFFVEKAKDGGKDFISLRMYQRSADIVLGVPTNLVFYSTLLLLVAKVCGFRPKKFIWSGGDVHLYANHFDKAKLLLEQDILPSPEMVISDDVTDLFKVKRSDILVLNYKHHPFIKFDVSV